ncbi:hypothetical protein PHYPSEUDO_014687 [Phytophthora pseudosyringae]|uniref:Uncharacterized protein n=1 Tax=Phytophthora pseudosyringae TaxID=221518 RepID=A0A8T1V504_9STRA|nr:hypothetical protein PHYPSEUDO_014687 [Phytophthora pseudosyringae]
MPRQALGCLSPGVNIHKLMSGIALCRCGRTDVIVLAERSLLFAGRCFQCFGHRCRAEIAAQVLARRRYSPSCLDDILERYNRADPLVARCMHGSPGASSKLVVLGALQTDGHRCGLGRFCWSSFAVREEGVALYLAVEVACPTDFEVLGPTEQEEEADKEAAP